MKWTYILIVLVLAAFVSGCVDKEQAETTKTAATPSTSATTGTTTSTASATPSVTTVSPGESSDDIFGTETNLTALDTTFNDMNMEISLVDSI